MNIQEIETTAKRLAGAWLKTQLAKNNSRGMIAFISDECNVSIADATNIFLSMRNLCSGLMEDK